MTAYALDPLSRARMAEVYALIEDTGVCERCGDQATNEIAIGLADRGEAAGERTLTTCLPCLLDLFVMLMRQGRLVA